MCQPTGLIIMSSNKEFKLISSAFNHNEFIPKTYSCEGKNISPPLEILNCPSGAESLVLVMDDPDAPGGVWTHWLVWNISPDTHFIVEDSIPTGAIEGRTSFGKTSYGGPCPPKGHGLHHYHFKLMVLNEKIELEEGASREALESVLKGRVVSEALLVGLYKRE